MYQVTASQTEQNIKLIQCVKKYPCLYDHNDQNYKNSVYVDKGWTEVSKEFNEPISDCKKKWRHLRSSLSRYLKSSKDLAKNKNNKLKPYYLLTHMNFLVPFTKTLETKTESTLNKYEPPDENQGEQFEDMKPEDPSYEHEIIQEDESQNMEDEEDIVYEAYEIQEQQLPSSSTASAQNQKSQITIVRSHPNNTQNTSIPQLQPIINSIASPSKPQSQTLQLNTSQMSQITQQQPNQQHVQNTIIPNNAIIPIADEQSADLNFFLALLPDIKQMNHEQKRKLRIGTLKLIDEILGSG